MTKPIVFGVDFGTTNSAIAYAVDGKIEVVPPEDYSVDVNTLPSLLYITKDHEKIVGRSAAERYMRENTGRASHLVKRKAGEVQIVVSGKGSPIIYWQPIYAMHDTLAPGRLLESIKTGLRSPDYTGTEAFNRFYRIEDLIAIVLSHLRLKAAAYVGCDVKAAVLGRPVRYSHDDEADQRAQRIMHEAATLAGFEHVEFLFEPIAAGYDYIRTCDLPTNICVFDFGGGTLDIAVMHVENREAPEILATAGLELGGDDFDKRLMTLLYDYFGAGSTVDGEPFPMGLLGYLQNWRSIPDICLPDNLRHLRRAQLRGSKPQTAKALESLATNHYGFSLYEEIEAAKVRLSSVERTTIRFTGKEIDIDKPLSRSHFGEVIREDLVRVSALIDGAMAASALTVDQIDRVIATGGSSQAVPVMQLLASRFGQNKVQSHNAFTSVVSGLAVRAKISGLG